MRIYNGTNSVLDLPLSGIQRLSIPPKSVSGDFMPTNEFLSLLVSTFDYSEISIIVSGPYEISMCASVSGSVGFVTQSLEEAIERFAEKVAPEAVKEEVATVNAEETKDNTCTCACCDDQPADDCPCVSFESESEDTDNEVVEEIQTGVKKTTKKSKKNK